jgi:hypothetical protein
MFASGNSVDITGGFVDPTFLAAVAIVAVLAILGYVLLMYKRKQTQ